jgi:hypothetical protein
VAIPGLLELSCVGSSVDAYFAIPAISSLEDLGPLGLPAIPHEVWIDLALLGLTPEGYRFAAGTFLGNGPHPTQPTPYIVRWSGLVPSRQHLFRINARVNDGWYQLRFGFFETPSCADVIGLSCDLATDTVTVRFRFPDAPLVPGPSVTRWLDLSTQDATFRTGTFIAAGPFPTTSGTFEWRGISKFLRHYYRINTQLASGEWGVLSGSFVSMHCDRSRTGPVF